MLCPNICYKCKKLDPDNIIVNITNISIPFKHFLYLAKKKLFTFEDNGGSITYNKLYVPTKYYRSK